MTVWKIAKTYQDAPHEYIVKQQHPHIYARYAELIREHGRPEKFTLRGRTSTYRYYHAEDGYKYWTCGVILNRCPA